jgi:4-hydroxybenzoate polyprenyltransferase
MVSDKKVEAAVENKGGSIRAYADVFRPDYWFKNIFTIMGMVGVVAYSGVDFQPSQIPRLFLAFLLSCFITSVGYVINEILDAASDAEHPVKKNRPIPSGRVSVDTLLLLDAILLLATMVISVLCFRPAFTILLMVYLFSAVIYNMRPIRTKDKPYLDIVNESVSPPIRFLIGWLAFDVQVAAPPLMAILMLWALGAYIMTGKRLAEMRRLGDDAARYRESFRFYTEGALHRMFVFSAALSCVFFIILALTRDSGVLYSAPMVALCLAWFYRLTLEKDSIVQQPELIVKQRLPFIIACLATFALMLFLML